MEFEELKEVYQELEKKHKLPSFEELNNIFDIGKLDKNTGNILRDIRGVLMEKVIHYVRLLELMINPTQSTPVFMIFLKQINSEDKETINQVFKSFVSLELESFKLDVDSDEGKEVAQIKNIFESWKKMQPNLKKLVRIMERNWNSDQKKDEKSKDYFS